MSKQIAIKGHKTRGKEVIEILEMLGGKNVYNLPGDTSSAYYVFEKGEIRCGEHIYGNEPYTIFTLEEFIKKYPFKVGDKAISNDGKKIVYIVGIEWDEYVGDLCYKVMKNNEDYIWFTSELIKLYRKETLQEQIDNSFKQLNQNISQMSECACNISTDIIKKEIVEKQEILIGLVPVKQGKELIPHKDYDIKQIDNKFYLVKKKPTYPKTYEECCKVLGCKSNHFYTDFSCDGLHVVISEYEDKINNLLHNFRKLIYCRDAYWKIAGEQMGLGKPWKQDYDDRCFIIANNNGNIYTYEYHGGNNVILPFPTPEMRDAFYENFKDLIEKCKQYLS